MVFRKEKSTDGFQRQFSALRHQLGGHAGEEPPGDTGEEHAHTNGDALDADATEQPKHRDHERGRYISSDSPYAAPVDSPTSPAPLDSSDPPSFDLSAFTSATDASVIAHDAFWQGDLRTNGSLHVHGTVKGTLEATENVYIAEEADVDGTVTAPNVIVGGLVKGAIRCSTRFEALASGRLLADVHAPSVVIHEGATMRGQFQMDQGAVAEEKPGQPYRRAARQR